MNMFVMTTATTPVSNNVNHSSSYIIAQVPSISNGNIETLPTTNNTSTALCDIKLICVPRKKKTKRHISVLFVESRPLSSSTDQPCIEIVSKTNHSSILNTYSLDECLSLEYFDTVKNDFQSFIFIYFDSFTLSIFFSDNDLDKKISVIKHLDYMHRDKSNQTLEQSQSQQPMLPCPSTTEHILHTFDVDLLAYGTIIRRDHILVGPVRLYFTITDLYIAALDCDRTNLKTAITNQCPTKDQAILCIPYFTIKHYGNRSNIFLIELGKSDYGNGEIRMRCESSSLAGTIHLLVSPVIEERPPNLSSAFQNQLLTDKRIEKSKHIQPPVQLNKDPLNNDSTLSFFNKIVTKTPTSISSSPNDSKSSSSTSVAGLFRTLAKSISPLKRSATFFNNHRASSRTLPITTSEHTTIRLLERDKSKFAAFPNEQNNADEHPIVVSTESQVTLKTNNSSMKEITSVETTIPLSPLPPIMSIKNSEFLLASSPMSDQEITTGTYFEMGPTVPKSDVSYQEEETTDGETTKETTATVDIGVNTTISLSPHVRSAIIVGNSVHLIADEKTLFPIGQRSFTSPACVMQPFKTQLIEHTAANAKTSSFDTSASNPTSSSSLHLPNSTSASQQSFLLSYGIVTFKDQTMDQSERTTSPTMDSSATDRRLNSDLSLVSFSQQPSHASVHRYDSVSSSSSAHILHNLSFSASGIGSDSATSSQLRTTLDGIIFLDEHLNDQTATYLLGQPSTIPDESTQAGIPRLSSFNLTATLSRPLLSHIDEENNSSNDPYALTEPLVSNKISTSLPLPSSPQPKFLKTSINYTDILLPSYLRPDTPTTGDQQQQQQQIQQQSSIPDDSVDESSDVHQQLQDNNEQSSTILYTDIDFQQTHRRDRIAQYAATPKIDDQMPPFVL